MFGVYILDPSYERAQKNLRYYADELKSRGQLTGEKGVLGSDDTLLYSEGDESSDDVDEEPPKEKSWRQSKAFRLYSKLCRSDPETLFNFVS